MSKINIDSEYDGYVFLGAAQGRFEPEGGQIGEKKDYFQMFVISPVSSFSSEDYSAFGFKAEKKRCVSADVWKELNIGDRVRLFFDDKKRVVRAALDGCEYQTTRRVAPSGWPPSLTGGHYIQKNMRGTLHG